MNAGDQEGKFISGASSDTAATETTGNLYHLVQELIYSHNFVY